MRITFTLDNDVATALQAEARRSGRAFRDVVNDALRRGLIPAQRPRTAPFEVAASELGGPARLPLENIGNLLDQLDSGPSC